MKHYLNVYKRLLIINFAQITAYRANFLNFLIAGTIWGFFSIFSILLITSKVDSVLGWSKVDILLLTVVNQIIIAIFHMLFSSNLERFPLYVEQGKLDSYLLKPIDSQVLVSIWFIRIISFSRVFMALIFLWYVIATYHIHINFIHVLMSIPLMIIGIAILYCIWFVICVLSIWFTRLTNIPEVLYTLNSVSRYPPQIYQELGFIIFLFVFPLTIIGVTPLEGFLGRLSLGNGLFFLVFAVVTLIITRVYWKFALRSYTSASS